MKTPSAPIGFRMLFLTIGLVVGTICFFVDMPFLDVKNEALGLLVTFGIMFFFGGIGFLLGWWLDRAAPGPSETVEALFHIFGSWT